MMANVSVTVTANPLSRSVPLAIMSVESGDAVGEYVTMVSGYMYTCVQCTLYMSFMPLLTHTLPSLTPSPTHL